LPEKLAGSVKQLAHFTERHVAWQLLSFHQYGEIMYVYVYIC